MKTLTENSCIRIDVTDTGKGMTPEVLDNIFVPFFTTKPGGTGVGLTVTQQIIDEHEGQLKVKSEAGKGTTFSVYLPMVCDEKEPMRHERAVDLLGQGVESLKTGGCGYENGSGCRG